MAASELAKQLAAKLFTDGRNILANRLVLEFDGGRYEGAPGWAAKSAADHFDAATTG